MTHPAHPDMAWLLRRLLETVNEAACGLEGRWRWLAGPLALLTGMRTRRERREAAEAMQAVQGMLQGFLTLLEDFRAGRLVPVAPSACEESASDNGVSAAGPRRARQSDAKWLGLWEWWRGKSEVPQEPECEDEAPTPVLRGSAGEGGRRERRGCAPLTLPLSRAPPSPSRGEGFKLSLTLAADQVRGRAVPRGAQDSVRNRHDRRGGRPGVIPGGRPPDFAAVGSRRRRLHPGYEDTF
jgi:hypothetical protein